MAPEDALAHLAALKTLGYAEAVLTGIHLGRYGQDLGADLFCFLKQAVDDPRMPRLRLSSIEPCELTPEIIALAASGKVRPHFHVPLQSGDNETLRRMGRPYTAEFFGELIRTVARAVPGAAIGVDVMTGFPGETDASFADTLALLEELPSAYLHVFPFSPRPGTPAFRFSGKVSSQVVKERSSVLRELGERKKREFRGRMAGKMMAVIVERAFHKDKTVYQGTTENYMHVLVKSGKPLRPGQEVAARIEAGPGEELFARAAEV
jgi:threonylcarbamoyladenosine tRNA methylthiotransferase MtaB